MSAPHGGESVRRYDGRTEHANWCADHSHQGLCLDFLTGWEPAPEQVVSEIGRDQIGDAGAHDDTRIEGQA